MGKKLLILSVLIVTILFGVIFWKVSDAEQPQQPMTDVSQKPTQPQPGTKTAAIVQPDKAGEPHQREQNRSDTNEAQTAVEQIAPPAFGFLPQGDIIQVVGLLSEYDKSGPLMRYIQRMCEEKRCNIDVAYQAEIIDAKWQDDIAGILALFASDGIRRGSLFIEAKTIKLEGEATDVKSALALQRYLNNLKEMDMEVVNHIEIEDWVAQAEPVDAKASVSDQSAKKSPQKQSETNTTVITTVIQKPEQAEPELQQVVQKAENNLTSQMVKEKSVQPIVLQAKRESATPTATPKVHKETSPETAHVKSVQKEVKQKVVKKQEKKRVIRNRKSEHKSKKSVKKAKPKPKKPLKDIIAPSYMETSIDLNRKITGRVYTQPVTDEAKKQTNTGDDIIAEPKLEILH